MREVSCSLGVSLDGYTAGPDGSFDWSAPDEELFRFATDEVRQLGVHFLGRHLYDAMRYWDEVEHEAGWSDLEREFADLWRALPKVVFSRTLTEVQDGYQLAQGDLAEEVARWRAVPGEGGIALGGPTLTADAVALDLVDVYRLRIHPVLVGAGTPYFPRAPRHSDLELEATQVFPATGVVHLRYRDRR